jgi:hypothetical protein
MHFALSGSSAIFPAFSFFVERKPLEISRLQITPLKFRPFWQENRGPTEIILRICTPFPGFSGFSQLQAFDLQPQAPIQPLQKKSCLKHYRRFFGCSGMCHDRRVNVEMTGRNEGCAGSAFAKASARQRWTAVKRPPSTRSVLERGTTVPLSDIPLEGGAGASALQNLSHFLAPITPNHS